MMIDPKDIAQLNNLKSQEKVKSEKQKRKSFVKTYDMLCKITSDYVYKRVGNC